jgi:hypothetical protein
MVGKRNDRPAQLIGTAARFIDAAAPILLGGVVVAVPVDRGSEAQTEEDHHELENLVIRSHCHFDVHSGHDCAGARERAAATDAEG